MLSRLKWRKKHKCILLNYFRPHGPCGQQVPFLQLSLGHHLMQEDGQFEFHVQIYPLKFQQEFLRGLRENCHISGTFGVKIWIFAFFLRPCATFLVLCHPKNWREINEAQLSVFESLSPQFFGRWRVVFWNKKFGFQNVPSTGPSMVKYMSWWAQTSGGPKKALKVRSSFLILSFRNQSIVPT